MLIPSDRSGTRTFRAVALLSITAEHDVSVPPMPTVALHRELSVRFAALSRHGHHELRGAGHLTNAAQWSEALTLTLRWLQDSQRVQPDHTQLHDHDISVGGEAN